MIATHVKHHCRDCGSENTAKNGHNSSGSQQYWCKDCNKRLVLQPKRGYAESEKELIIAAFGLLFAAEQSKS